LPVDIQSAKKLGAVDYMVKPADHDEMMKLVLKIHERWLSGTPAKVSDLAQSVPTKKAVL
jgi:ActR/RegA family two-component response regulator